jgi:threonine dehydrogenase-like Zn-dependent dehydrogenase
MRALVYDIKPWGWAACKLLRPFWPGCQRSPLGGLSLRDVDLGDFPGSEWVRVRTLLGGICGTDLSILAQKQPPDSILQAFSSMPMLMGHENVGVVEDVASGVEASWKGKRVCVEPTLGCTARGIVPACERCQAGEFGACENFGDAGTGGAAMPPGTSIGYNSRTGGSFGETFYAHVTQLVELPESIDNELAVLTDPLACSLHAALRSRWSEARRVLVYGAGVLGLGLIAGLRAIGYSRSIDALDNARYLEKPARSFGADEFLSLDKGRGERFARIAERTGGTIQKVRFGNLMLSGGYDIVFDCVGSPQSLAESLKWTRARGQVVIVGTGSGGNVDLTPIWFRELEVLGAYGRQVESFAGRRIDTYRLVHEFMTQGKLDVRPMLTHTFPLADYRLALDVAMNKNRHGAVKVAFDFR